MLYSSYPLDIYSNDVDLCSKIVLMELKHEQIRNMVGLFEYLCTATSAVTVVIIINYDCDCGLVNTMTYTESKAAYKPSNVLHIGQYDNIHYYGPFMPLLVQ